MIKPIIVPMTLSQTNTTIDMSVDSTEQTLDAVIDVQVGIVGADTYDGEYEWTPSQETQTIPISNKRALQDIIINPIPNNYGLITWDGSTLTVS